MGEGATHHFACDCREKYITDLKRRYREAIEALRSIQYGYVNEGEDGCCNECPECYSEDEHDDDCNVGKVLREAEDEGY